MKAVTSHVAPGSAHVVPVIDRAEDAGSHVVPETAHIVPVTNTEVEIAHTVPVTAHIVPAEIHIEVVIAYIVAEQPK